MTENSLKKILKILLMSAAVILLLYISYLLADIIIILVIALLLAFIFEPLVVQLEKEGFSRLNSTFMIFILVGLSFYLALSFIIPKLIYQMNQLVAALQVYSLHDQLISIEKGIYKYLPFFEPGELSKRIEEFISFQIVNSFDKLSSLVTGIVSVIALLFIVPFLTFFLLKDSKKLFKGILGIVPNNYFEMSYWILKRVSVQLGRFVRAWIFDASFVGVICGVGFYIIGIDYALPLGVIAGLGHLVPYLGPIIGGIPAIIISIIQYGDLSQVPFILLVLFIVYSLDNGFVQPYVFAKSVDMHPIMIILLILAGSQLFGVFGMLLAIPVTSVVKTAAKEIYFAFKNYKIARL
jgi:putative permease